MLKAPFEAPLHATRGAPDLVGSTLFGTTTALPGRRTTPHPASWPLSGASSTLSSHASSLVSRDGLLSLPFLKARAGHTVPLAFGRRTQKRKGFCSETLPERVFVRLRKGRRERARGTRVERDRSRKEREREKDSYFYPFFLGTCYGKRCRRCQKEQEAARIWKHEQQPSG